MLFRLDADPTMQNSWGGTFPEGPRRSRPTLINVPGGKYIIYFNCKLATSSLYVPVIQLTHRKCSAMTVDGLLNEAD